MLLIFLGARKSEILTLRWDQIDWEHECLRLGTSKTGPKVIYLNRPTVALLKALPRLEGNPHVIPGNKKGTHIVNIARGWNLIRTQAKLHGVRLHDLRHSFASVGAGAGLGLPVLGGLLGHKDAATTQRYAHLAADPLRQANELIGDRLAQALQNP